jgi:hypothetical protein
MYGGNIDLILFIIFGLFMLGLFVYKVVSSQINKSRSKLGGKPVGKSSGKSNSKPGIKPTIVGSNVIYVPKNGYNDDMPFF